MQHLSDVSCFLQHPRGKQKTGKNWISRLGRLFLPIYNSDLCNSSVYGNVDCISAKKTCSASTDHRHSYQRSSPQQKQHSQVVTPAPHHSGNTPRSSHPQTEQEMRFTLRAEWRQANEHIGNAGRNGDGAIPLVYLMQ